MIFPDLNSLFSLYKLFFLSVTALVVIEYLIMFELPPNFLLSRAVSLAVMLLVSTVFYSAYFLVFGTKIRLAFMLPVTAVSVFFGQIIAYRMQGKQSIRWGYGLGFLSYFLIAGLLMGATLFKPNWLFF